MSVCARVCVHMCTCRCTDASTACDILRTTLGVCLSFPPGLKQGICCSSPHTPGSLPVAFWGPSRLTEVCWAYTLHHIQLSLHFTDLNSGPHICAANTLSAELSPCLGCCCFVNLTQASVLWEEQPPSVEQMPWSDCL